jgi:hypothetical protein
MLHLSPNAQRALALSRAETGGDLEPAVGPEHLIGLLLDTEGPAARVLRESGCDEDRVRAFAVAQAP